MSASVKDLIAELTAAKPLLVGLARGYNDLLALGLSASADLTVQDVKNRTDRRYTLISIALQAMQNLDADGYPSSIIGSANAAVIQEMQDQITRMEASISQLQGMMSSMV
jgi:TolA-binding protein